MDASPLSKKVGERRPPASPPHYTPDCNTIIKLTDKNHQSTNSACCYASKLRHTCSATISCDLSCDNRTVNSMVCGSCCRSVLFSVSCCSRGVPCSVIHACDNRCTSILPRMCIICSCRSASDARYAVKTFFQRRFSIYLEFFYFSFHACVLVWAKLPDLCLSK